MNRITNFYLFSLLLISCGGIKTSNTVSDSETKNVPIESSVNILNSEYSPDSLVIICDEKAIVFDYSKSLKGEPGFRSGDNQTVNCILENAYNGKIEYEKLLLKIFETKNSRSFFKDFPISPRRFGKYRGEAIFNILLYEFSNKHDCHVSDVEPSYCPGGTFLSICFRMIRNIEGTDAQTYVYRKLGPITGELITEDDPCTCNLYKELHKILVDSYEDNLVVLKDYGEQ